jgi:hypothetical protein
VPKTQATLFEMTLPPEIKDVAEDFVGDIAATEEGDARPAMLQRLPLSFDPAARFAVARKLSYGDAAMTPAHFERPEGSFEARVLGNAIHAFVELLTKRLADGTDVQALVREVNGWTPRIAAVLRGDGLAPDVVDRLVARVKMGLNNMLKDVEGLWVLRPHEGAMSEFALTSWDERRSSVRLDRVFLGGEEPLQPGNDYLWIIDYKTATHGREGLEEFFADERAKYGPQIEAYARAMADRVGEGRLRVGLYYPMLVRLVWWAPEMAAASVTT